MNKLNLHLVTFLTCLFANGLTSTNAVAQDPPPKPASAESVTTGEPGIAIDHLRLLLTPLTRDQLLSEAEAWRAVLMAKAQEIAGLEISLRKDADADPANRSETLKTLVLLREQKSTLIMKLNAVCEAYSKKGGDPKEFRQYAEAVSVIALDVKDVGGTWSTVTGWLTSKEGGLNWGAKILKFLATVFAFWIIAKIVGRLVGKALSMNKRASQLLIEFVNNIIGRVILFIGVLVGLSLVGFNVGALVALIGGGAFILAFALQDTLGNLAAGLMLLIYRPFDVSDVVELGGVNGKVDKLSLVTTTIRTFDNRVVLVPNKKVWGEVITNASASNERRVDLVFGIGYEDDIAKAQDVLERITEDHELILKDPKPVIKVHALADSSVNFICRPWVKTADYWDVYWDLTRAVKEEFDRAGISLPYPQQEIHIHTANTAERVSGQATET